MRHRPPPPRAPSPPGTAAPTWAADLVTVGDDADRAAPSAPATAPAGTTGHGRRWRVVAVGVVGVVALLQLVGRFGGSVEDDVVLLPPSGDVHADVLDDGTPVFVVHTGDGTALVLEALVPGAAPVGEVVGWCPATRQLVAAHYGAVYDHRGRRSAHGVRGRAGADARIVEPSDGSLDLYARATERVPGFDGAGDPVRVGERLAQGDERGSTRPDARVVTRPPAWCRAPAPVLRDSGLALDADVPSRALRAHDDLVRPLADALQPQSQGRWVVVDAAVVRAADGSATACAALADDPGPPACGEDAVPVAPSSSSPAAGLWTLLEGPLAVRASGRTITDVAVLPSSRWRGAGFRGSEVHRGLLEPFVLDDGALRWRRSTAALVPQEGFPCVAPDSTGGSLPLDGDATVLLGDPLVDAGGAGAVRPVSAVELARVSTALRPPGSVDVPVEVVVDRSTCRVLRVEQIRQA